MNSYQSIMTQFLKNWSKNLLMLLKVVFHVLVLGCLILIVQRLTSIDEKLNGGSISADCHLDTPLEVEIVRSIELETTDHENSPSESERLLERLHDDNEKILSTLSNIESK